MSRFVASWNGRHDITLGNETRREKIYVLGRRGVAFIELILNVTASFHLWASGSDQTVFLLVS